MAPKWCGPLLTLWFPYSSQPNSFRRGSCSCRWAWGKGGRGGSQLRRSWYCRYAWRLLREWLAGVQRAGICRARLWCIWVTPCASPAAWLQRLLMSSSRFMRKCWNPVIQLSPKLHLRQLPVVTYIRTWPLSFFPVYACYSFKGKA